MTDVYIVTLSIIGFLITGPALAVALNLLMPRVTERASLRLERTPVVSFVVGVVVSVALALWVIILLQFSFGLLQAVGFISALFGLGMYSIGAAGMSRLLGKRVGNVDDSGSSLGFVARGAVVLELACFVPLVGWFLFTPLAGIMMLGASAFALIGWGPRTASKEKEHVSENQNKTSLSSATMQATNPELG